MFIKHGIRGIQVLIIDFLACIAETKLFYFYLGNLIGETQFTAQTTYEDVFIRKFVFGTWPTLFASEIIIKRRQNMIIICGIVTQDAAPRSMYFLKGYTEELLSLFLKRPVKMEIQSVTSLKDMHFKMI